MVTKGMAEAFWRRFDATLEAQHYQTLKDYMKEFDLGVSYQGILWKRANRIMPTIETIITISTSLDVSIDYLIYGYKRQGKPIADDEMDLIFRYRNSNETVRHVIDTLLDDSKEKTDA